MQAHPLSPDTTRKMLRGGGGAPPRGLLGKLGSQRFRVGPDAENGGGVTVQAYTRLTEGVPDSS